MPNSARLRTSAEGRVQSGQLFQPENKYGGLLPMEMRLMRLEEENDMKNYWTS